jgi:hypothetical protein
MANFPLDKVSGRPRNGSWNGLTSSLEILRRCKRENLMHQVYGVKNWIADWRAYFQPDVLQNCQFY